MNGLWWLVLGLLAGWLIELVIDYRYWRREARINAARLAEQEAALNARSRLLDAREAEQNLRSEELTNLQAALAARDSELLGLARRIDERAEEVTRLEQAMDKRRADLERMGFTLNEREKDIGARDGKLKSAEVDYASRHEALQAAEADVSRRGAVVSNRESAMQNWEARILAREHELGDKEAHLVREAAAAADLRAELSAMKQLVSRQYKTADGADKLEAIEGVDEKIAGLLHEADIRTFERLSETSLGELTRVLEAGGPRLGLADPLTWAEQAACLVSGDYIAFERMKSELIGGNRRDAELLQKTAEPGVADITALGMPGAAVDAAPHPHGAHAHGLAEAPEAESAGEARGAEEALDEGEAEGRSPSSAEEVVAGRVDEHGPTQAP